MSQESGKTVNGVRIALHPPGSARQRRTLDERLRVRFPALVRPVGAAFLRLPPSWRLRRLMLARSILRAYAVRWPLVGWARRVTYVIGRDGTVQDAHHAELSGKGHVARACGAVKTEPPA